MQAHGTPSAAEYRHALRQVVGRCIYGVDLNPMAVELCKVSLWMEAVEPGLPLTFLDSHIRHGNALMGTTPELMYKGIPDDAWNPIEGDDKKVATALKKRNKDSAQGQRGFDTLWSEPRVDEADELRNTIAALESALDVDAAGLAAKESRWQELLESKAYQHQKLLADAWCAAFVWPKQPGPLAEAAPTNELWRQILDGQGHPPELTVKTVKELAEQYAFFHWHLAFPQVFGRGGFDVVLGNPPWEQVEVSPIEFFAVAIPEILAAKTKTRRNAVVESLSTTALRLYESFNAHKRRTNGTQHFLHNSRRFPFGTSGRLNSAPLFLEASTLLSSASGRVGLIVPTGIATDTFTRHLFGHLVATGRLRHLFDFENEEFLFPNVHHAMRFCLLSAGGPRPPGRTEFEAQFFARKTSDLREPEKRATLSHEDLGLLNPETRTCPSFRSRRDVELLRKIALEAGTLAKPKENNDDWGFQGRLMFMMDAGEDVFRNADKLQDLGYAQEGVVWRSSETRAVPLLEGKMVHHFDHRFGSYAGQSEAQARQGKLPESTEAQHFDANFAVTPRYWVDEVLAGERIKNRWHRPWYIAWRDITNSKNERTVIAAVVPPYAAGDTLPLALVTRPSATCASFLANACAFVFDFAARQKVSGMHLRFTTFAQLNFLGPKVFESTAKWDIGATAQDWILPRALELTYTAWDLEPFARDVGYDGPPFRWDPERRFLLRAELDAAFFHLYGIERDDVDYIMETFPIVRKNDEKAHGEYRTKRVILEIYDEMAEVMKANGQWPVASG